MKTKEHLLKAINHQIEISDMWIKKYELAEVTGLSLSTINNVFKGTASIESVEKVAKALNIEIIIKDFTI